MSKPLKLIISVAIPLLAGAVGSLFTAPSVGTWYATIQKPSFNPPDWIFGPVWTTLFVLMGLACYLVWTSGAGTRAKQALALYAAQLALNVLWSVLFFGLHNPLAALVDIALLWAAILATIIMFYRVNKIAAYLLVPYILWVSFASVLNSFIVALN